MLYKVFNHSDFEAQTIQLLLDNKADINARNNDGLTPYDIAKNDEIEALLEAAN